MTIHLLFIFISSLTVSMALIPFLIRSAARLGVLDQPEERKIHTMPVARVGGIAFAVGALASLLCWTPVDALLLSYLMGASVILCFGVVDDRMNLDPKDKLLAQLLASLMVVGVGGLYIKTLPFWNGELSPWIGVPITFLFLIGVTNAVNLSDGLDGLAGGLCLLSFSGIAYLGFLSGDATVMAISLSILGGIFGFLRFNTHPARVFMGDGGSQFLGFSAAFAAIVLIDPGRGPYSFVTGLWLIGLPLLDTLGVMVQRWREGRSLFSADKNHLHHRLLSAGLSHSEAVTWIYALQALMIGVGLLFYGWGDGELMTAYAAFTLGLFSIFFSVGRGWLCIRPVTLPLPSVGEGKGERSFSDWPMQLLGIAIPVFLTLSVFVPTRIPSDFGLLAITLFSLLLAGLWAFRQSAPLLIRLGLYTGGAFLVYLSDQASAGWPIQIMVNLFFSVVAVLIVIVLRLNREAPFETTPLDYLVLIVALMVPELPEIRLAEVSIGRLAAKLLVLFFAYELLLARPSDRPSGRLQQLGTVALWDLLALGLRAWWP